MKAHRYKPFKSPDHARTLGWYHGYTGERCIYKNDYYVQAWERGHKEMLDAHKGALDEIMKEDLKE